MDKLKQLSKLNVLVVCGKNKKGPLGFTLNGNAIHFHLGIYRDQLTIPQTLYFDQFCRSVKKLIVLPNHSTHSNQDTCTYN